MGYNVGYIPRTIMIGVAVCVGVFSLVLLGLGAGALGNAHFSVTSGGGGGGQDCSNNGACCSALQSCCSCVVWDGVSQKQPNVNYCFPGVSGCGPIGSGGSGGTSTSVDVSTPKLNAAGAFSIITGVFGAGFVGYICHFAIKDIEVSATQMGWFVMCVSETVFCLIALALWASEVDYVQGLWSLASANLAFSVCCFVAFIALSVDAFMASRNDNSSSV
jgi:hypothetical protein